MFIVDINILSAMMSAQPVPQVAAWVAEQKMDLLFTASVCQAEILSGLAIMPQGRRREALEVAAADRSARPTPQLGASRPNGCCQSFVSLIEVAPVHAATIPCFDIPIAGDCDTGPRNIVPADRRSGSTECWSEQA
jgi:hypothetical protein